jgi:RAB6A-GEF complex partner protein 1
VSLMRWTPEGVALAIAWERGGFSIWSVFGSLLYHSMGVEAG